MNTIQQPKRNKANTFVGNIQPCSSRVPENPPVNYLKGGSDFRVIENTSSFGKQLQSGEFRKTAPVVVFPAAPRFSKSDSVGPGPNFLAQPSSLGKQRTSNRRSNGAVHFGTSTRDGALRLYTLGNSKRN